MSHIPSGYESRETDFTQQSNQTINERHTDVKKLAQSVRELNIDISTLNRSIKQQAKFVASLLNGESKNHQQITASLLKNDLARLQQDRKQFKAELRTLNRVHAFSSMVGSLKKVSDVFVKLVGAMKMAMTCSRRQQANDEVVNPDNLDLTPEQMQSWLSSNDDPNQHHAANIDDTFTFISADDLTDLEEPQRFTRPDLELVTTADGLEDSDSPVMRPRDLLPDVRSTETNISDSDI